MLCPAAPAATSPTAAAVATAARPSGGFAARSGCSASGGTSWFPQTPSTGSLRGQALRPDRRTCYEAQPGPHKIPPNQVEANNAVLTVGAGCAGMRAASEPFAAGADVALPSKT